MIALSPLSPLWITDPPRAARTVAEALSASRGNITYAAQRLGVSRSTLHRWLRRHRSLIERWPLPPRVYG